MKGIEPFLAECARTGDAPTAEPGASRRDLGDAGQWTLAQSALLDDARPGFQTPSRNLDAGCPEMPTACVDARTQRGVLRQWHGPC
jgi:hypothetical protein